MKEEEVSEINESRRAVLKAGGQFAVLTPPAMTMLLSTSMNSDAVAKSGGARVKGNNGVGNLFDPQPPGDPPVNDGVGTRPGSPGNKGGAKRK